MDLNFEPSKYQKAIFDFIRDESGNLMIQAYAGAGKTTTILKATEYIPRRDSSIFVAFNKDIASDINNELSQLTTTCSAKTLHSAGFGSFRRNVSGKIIVDFSKLSKIIDRLILINKIKDGDVLKSFLMKIIPFVKATMSETSVVALLDLAQKYDISYSIGTYEASFIKQILEECKLLKNIVDYEDMIWLPLTHNFTFEKYDWVFVDELQDLNRSQFEIIKKLCHKNTRVIGVGDSRQAMYAWRGADRDTMDNFKRHFDAKELPLSICYRCPPNITRLAQKIVPQIEPCNKPDGIIEYIDEGYIFGKARVGDLILCRTNAPLVKLAFEFIRQHKKVVILGRNLCKNLIKLISNYKTNDLSELRKKVINLRDLQREHIQEIYRGTFEKSRMGELLTIIDKCDTLLAIAEGVKSIQELRNVIYKIFSDKEEGIILSTVHKAKGSGYDRVFIYGYNSLMPLPFLERPDDIVQEMNIKYVAITRSKKELYLCD